MEAIDLEALRRQAQEEAHQHLNIPVPDHHTPEHSNIFDRLHDRSDVHQLPEKHGHDGPTHDALAPHKKKDVPGWARTVLSTVGFIGGAALAISTGAAVPLGLAMMAGGALGGHFTGHAVDELVSKHVAHAGKTAKGAVGSALTTAGDAIGYLIKPAIGLAVGGILATAAAAGAVPLAPGAAMAIGTAVSLLATAGKDSAAPKSASFAAKWIGLPIAIVAGAVVGMNVAGVAEYGLDAFARPPLAPIAETLAHMSKLEVVGAAFAAGSAVIGVVAAVGGTIGGLVDKVSSALGAIFGSDTPEVNRANYEGRGKELKSETRATAQAKAHEKETTSPGESFVQRFVGTKKTGSAVEQLLASRDDDGPGQGRG